MNEQVKKLFKRLEALPPRKQEEIASLIEEELDWDAAFERTQDQLSRLAKEALEEYEAGDTSDKDW